MGLFKSIVNYIFQLFGFGSSPDAVQTHRHLSPSPTDVYRRVIGSKTQSYNELKTASAQINTQVRTLQDELKNLSEEYELIDLELDYALMHGDDEAALELLKIREGDDVIFEKKKTILSVLSTQAEEVMAQIAQVQSELSDLKSELQQVEADEVSVELQQLLDRLKSDRDVNHLSAVRDVVAQRRTEAELDQVIRDNSFEAKRASFQKNIAASQSQNRREEQLDRLKQYYREHKLTQS